MVVVMVLVRGIIGGIFTTTTILFSFFGSFFLCCFSFDRPCMVDAWGLRHERNGEAVLS